MLCVDMPVPIRLRKRQFHPLLAQTEINWLAAMEYVNE
jgi:hypothetical protein